MGLFMILSKTPTTAGLASTIDSHFALHISHTLRSFTRQCLYTGLLGPERQQILRSSMAYRTANSSSLRGYR